MIAWSLETELACLMNRHSSGKVCDLELFQFVLAVLLQGLRRIQILEARIRYAGREDVAVRLLQVNVCICRVQDWLAMSVWLQLNGSNKGRIFLGAIWFWEFVEDDDSCI